MKSRPLTYLKSESGECLGTSKFPSLPPASFYQDTNFSSMKIFIKEFNYWEILMRSLWSRWKNEYLLNLVSAHFILNKIGLPQFKVSQKVLIKDDYLPRSFWKLGRILELFSERDGKVWAYRLKTESS